MKISNLIDSLVLKNELNVKNLTRILAKGTQEYSYYVRIANDLVLSRTENNNEKDYYFFNNEVELKEYTNRKF